MLTNSVNVGNVLQIDSCSYLAKCNEEILCFRQNKCTCSIIFICYHPESGWHVTRPNQGLSLGRGEDWERSCDKCTQTNRHSLFVHPAYKHSAACTYIPFSPHSHIPSCHIHVRVHILHAKKHTSPSLLYPHKHKYF